MCTLIHSRSSHKHSFGIKGTPTIYRGSEHLPAVVNCTSCILCFTKLQTPTASLQPTFFFLIIPFFFPSLRHPVQLFFQWLSESTSCLWAQRAQSHVCLHSHGMWSVSYGQSDKDLNEISISVWLIQDDSFALAFHHKTHTCTDTEIRAQLHTVVRA